jgi:hypothetical protein
VALKTKHGGVLNMKVKKTIKKIVALGMGATMMGATLMGAAAADLSNYPGMFMDDDNAFDGLLVVGKNANAVDTIGVTNIALGLQKAAVTTTQVCGDSTGSTTSVSGESIDLEKPGTDLTIGDNLTLVQSVAVDDADLPSLLADGEFKDNEGTNAEDIEYDQELVLNSDTGFVNYYFDKDDADPSGMFLKFEKGETVYTYNLEFKTDLEFDDDTSDPDLEQTQITIQGKEYTITDVDMSTSGGLTDIDKIKLMAGNTAVWLEEQETITKEIDGVDYTIKMIDIDNGGTQCQLQVDDTIDWIDVDDTETFGALTIGVTDAIPVNNENSDGDTCQIFIGAVELELEAANDDAVKVGGSDIEGSSVTFTTTGDASVDGAIWTDLSISYEADEDVYLGAGDEWVDPIFGNFKFIVGSVVAENEEIEFSTSSNDGILTFTSYDDKEVEIPFVMDGEGVAYYLGTDEAREEDGWYVEGQTINCPDNDVEKCDGAKFIGISDKVIHVIEITNIDADDEEITLYDTLYDSETKDASYVNSTDSTISVRGGLGDIELHINEGAGTIKIETSDDSVGGFPLVYTENEAVIKINVSAAGDLTNFVVSENADESDDDATVNVTLSNDEDDLEFSAPASTDFTAGSSYKVTDDNDDDVVYVTNYGMMVSYDSDAKDIMTFSHPEEELYLEVKLAEAGAVASESGASSEGCTTSTTLNPIPSTVNKFDTEAMSMYSTTNVISVGGPCANSVTSKLLGSPEVCYEGFEEGKALLQLVESGNNVALIVAGGTGKDTQLASRILQDYEDYDLAGTKMIATTVSESGLKVEAYTEPVVAEPEVVVEDELVE